MYGIEYEDDILLLLRMIKFLHMQSPDCLLYTSPSPRD